MRRFFQVLTNLIEVQLGSVRVILTTVLETIPEARSEGVVDAGGGDSLLINHLLLRDLIESRIYNYALN